MKLLKNFFDLPLFRYQIGLQTQMRESGFIFDCVNLLYYKCHRINFKRGDFYIDFLDWIKKHKGNNKP